eukprot:TRINITY_DN4249_c0_g2_i2.p1 TRINITY_DN4249_c0_g2~~TRINITY_DN4249_c0_g2_i2.p1  ORF type:complete len:102 (+),score=9.32 TRINITY_DN4249_c0_g2_i2:238-543(+)
MTFNSIKIIILLVIIMGTPNNPSQQENELALKISTLEETHKVNTFWETVHEEQKKTTQRRAPKTNLRANVGAIKQPIFAPIKYNLTQSNSKVGTDDTSSKC